MGFKYYRGNWNTIRCKRDENFNDRINIMRQVETTGTTILLSGTDFSPRTVPQFGPMSQNIEAQYHQAWVKLSLID